MPAKFDFLSPGVLLREIDQSQVPAATSQDGILIVGVSPSGPALKPVRVRDLDSFLEIFGNPSSGKGTTNDVWRNGSFGPTYGMYAAQAWPAAFTEFFYCLLYTSPSPRDGLLYRMPSSA